MTDERSKLYREHREEAFKALKDLKIETARGKEYCILRRALIEHYDLHSMLDFENAQS